MVVAAAAGGAAADAGAAVADLRALILRKIPHGFASADGADATN